jgi:hypothetical protein
MFYRLAADAMSALHLALMLFLIFGQLAIIVGIIFRWRWIRNPTFRWVHMAIILIVAVEAILEINCPLTDWERDLRRLGGAWGEEMSFTARVVRWLLFPDVSMDFLFACYIGFAVTVLLTFIIAPPWIRAPRGRMVLKLGCASGANGKPAAEPLQERKARYAEVAVDRPREGACTRTVVCPVCEQSVDIAVRSRRLFAIWAVLLALLGAGIACAGVYWSGLGLPAIPTSWQNTVTVVGLVLFVLAPSGLLIRKALVTPNGSAVPVTSRHRLFA